MKTVILDPGLSTAQRIFSSKEDSCYMKLQGSFLLILEHGSRFHKRSQYPLTASLLRDTTKGI